VAHLWKKLRDAGAVLPKGKKALTQMLETVASSDAPEEWIYEKQTGWLKGGKAFVRVHGVIGAPEANIIGINQSKAVIDRIGKQALAGTWRAWRDTVAGPARHSTTLMLAICVALAAPLLDVVRRQSFALNCLVPATLERAWQLSWRHR
jgi:uncharacterized protein (DUF927 family)